MEYLGNWLILFHLDCTNPDPDEDEGKIFESK